MAGKIEKTAWIYHLDHPYTGGQRVSVFLNGVKHERISKLSIRLRWTRRFSSPTTSDTVRLAIVYTCILRSICQRFVDRNEWEKNKKSHCLIESKIKLSARWFFCRSVREMDDKDDQYRWESGYERTWLVRLIDREGEKESVISIQGSYPRRWKWLNHIDNQCDQSEESTERVGTTPQRSFGHGETTVDITRYPQDLVSFRCVISISFWTCLTLWKIKIFDPIGSSVPLKYVDPLDDMFVMFFLSSFSKNSFFSTSIRIPSHK